MGEASDIVAAVLFRPTDDSRYRLGAEQVVDGSVTLL